MEKKSYGGKTQKLKPSACRGLNKTNCIFPCEYVKRKMNEQIGYCRTKFINLEKKAKSKKHKKMIQNMKNKTMTSLKKAEKKIKEGTREVEKATKKMDESSGLYGMMGSISSFFTPSTENKTMEEAPAPKENEDMTTETEDMTTETEDATTETEDATTETEDATTENEESEEIKPPAEENI